MEKLHAQRTGQLICWVVIRHCICRCLAIGRRRRQRNVISVRGTTKNAEIHLFQFIAILIVIIYDSLRLSTLESSGRVESN